MQADQTYGGTGTREEDKKGITLGDAFQILTLYNLVKQRDEFRYLCSNFWQVWHSWFCGKMVMTTFKTI